MWIRDERVRKGGKEAGISTGLAGMKKEKSVSVCVRIRC